MHAGAMMMAARTASEPPPLPAAPTGLMLASVSSAIISASWTDNASNEDEYQAAIATDAGFSNILDNQVLAADSTSTTFSGLSPDTTYWVRVRAFNSTGGSAYISGSTTTLGASPDTPSNVSGLMESPTSIRVWWWDNADDESAYRVRAYSNAGGGGTLLDTEDVAANTETALLSFAQTTNGSFFVRVRAQFAGGESSIWAEAEVRMRSSADPPDAAPSNNALAPTSTTSLTQTWDDNASNETFQHVQLALDSGFTNNVRTAEKAAGVESHVWTGLDPDTEYFSRVRAFKDGPTAWSGTDSALTVADNPPPVPSGHSVTDQQPTQLTHVWTDPAGQLTEVDAEVAEDAGFSVGLQQDHGISTGVETKTWTSLTEGTPYWVRVRGVNAAGDGAWSTLATGTQLAAPSSLDGADHGTFFRLTWTDNSAESDFIEIHRDTGGGFALLDTIAASEVQYDVAADSGTEYKIRVTSSEAFPDSEFSNTFTDPS